MKRTLSLTAATLALLTGCGSADETSTDAPAAPQPAAAIPSPSTEQAEALVAKLDDIAPGLAGEPKDTIDNARNTCSSVLGEAQNLVEATKVRFTKDGVDDVTQDQAERIIEAVRAEPWCS